MAKKALKVTAPGTVFIMPNDVALFVYLGLRQIFTAEDGVEIDKVTAGGNVILEWVAQDA